MLFPENSHRVLVMSLILPGEIQIHEHLINVKFRRSRMAFENFETIAYI